MAGKKRRKRRKTDALGLFFLTLFATVTLGSIAVLAGWAVMDGREEGGAFGEGVVSLLEGDIVQAAQGEERQTGEQVPDNAASGSGSQSAGGPAVSGTEGENAAGDGLQEPGFPSAGGKYADILADPERMRQENIYTVTPTVPGEITLTFAGDILFDDGYSIMAKMKSRTGGNPEAYVESAFDAPMLEAMRGADIFMVNNEFTYTLRGAPTPDKKFTFHARPEHARLLGDMGADLVSLANNHSRDYGEISLLDTLDTLQEVGIPYVGAGRNLAEAVRPVYFIAGDVKIAFLSATQIERMDNPSTKGATETSPGVFRCRNVDRLLEEVAAAKAVSDYVVVYVHWGTESTSEPDWAQKEQAPKIAEAGADLIIGDHPHVLQGIGWFGETPVIYSLGNYLFNSKTQDTCLVTATLDTHTGELKSLRFIPALQKDCRTTMHEGAEKSRVLRYIQGLSPESRIDEEGYITKS